MIEPYALLLSLALQGLTPSLYFSDPALIEPILTDPVAALSQPGPSLQDSGDLIVRSHSSPNLRPDSRGFLATPTGPVLEMGRVRLAIDYKRTEYDGLRDGGQSLSPDEVLAQGFFRVPQSGSLETTELRAEYGISENATLRVQLPFEKRSVSYARADGTSERHTSLGLADVRLSGSIEFSVRDQERLEFLFGLRVPTGSTREQEDSAGTGLYAPRLPYALQLGGGTFALMPGMYWTRWSGNWSVGVGGQANLPTGTGERGWSLGDSFQGQVWVARRVDTFRAVTFGLEYSGENAVQGLDPIMDPLYDPSEFAKNVGGQVVSANLGLHMAVEQGNHLGLEIGAPFWQDLHGPQLEEQYHFRVGWWLSF